ncbi:MAG: 3-phosphoshikimate 1-carboxyvinyltransferase [Bacteroidales bacterium]|nr:3-phosphoshikimate 1-carboxyvinyltransferase [Bacteroidales bacterium]
MGIYTITRKGFHEGTGVNLAGTIALPSSKSISNRVLLIRTLSPIPFEVENLSEADDTMLMQQLLNQIETATPPVSIDCRNAGTVMRFLTAYLSLKPGSWLLTGSTRMQQRPIGILVEALRSLGASIEYEGTPGYPPLRISGKELKGGAVTVDVSISSQFVSALLMIAPLLPEGLTISMTGEQVSSPYVEMTTGIMKEFGIVTERKEESIMVHPGRYTAKRLTGGRYSVEADWSSAAFWYEAAALSGSANITLPGLRKNSLQGDSVLAKLFRPLGVETTFEGEGVKLICEQSACRNTKYEIRNSVPASIQESPFAAMDLKAFPDLALPLIVSYAALGIPARFTGLHHLKVKESDRLHAIVTELERCHISIGNPASGIIETAAYPLPGSSLSSALPVTIETYGDHRIAMAFALLAIKTGTIRMSDPSVVSKSYPGFWEEMRRLGFEIAK